MKKNNCKLINLFIYFILLYTVLNQNLIKSILDKFISNALIINIIIFIFYIGLIDIVCVYNIIKNKERKKYNIKRLVFLSFIVGILLPYNVIYTTSFSQLSIIFNILILMFIILSLGLMDYSFFYRRNNINLIINVEQINCKWYFIIPFLSISMTWIKNFPALMSFDSYYQLEQIFNNSFNDVHPAAHTLFIKLLLGIYNSPAIVVFFQIFSLSLGIWWIFTFIDKQGVDKKILFTIVIVWSCMTPIQTITCYLWKDVFYSISLLFSTIGLIKIIIYKNRTKILDIFILAISLAIVFLFRHNGAVPFLFTIISIFYLTYRDKCKKYLLVVLTSILIIVSTKTILYDIYNVEPNNNGTKYAIFAKAVVSVIANDGNYTDEELQQINSIIPYEVIKRNYDWSKGYNLLWNIQSEDAEYGFGNLTTDEGKIIIKLFIELLPRNFITMFWDILGSATIMWQLDFIDINLFSIHIIYFLPILICSFLFIKNKRYKEFIPFIPCIANIISIIVSNISYEYRYGYPTMVMLPVILIYTIYSFVISNRDIYM